MQFWRVVVVESVVDWWCQLIEITAILLLRLWQEQTSEPGAGNYSWRHSIILSPEITNHDCTCGDPSLHLISAIEDSWVKVKYFYQFLRLAWTILYYQIIPVKLGENLKQAGLWGCETKFVFPLFFCFWVGSDRLGQPDISSVTSYIVCHDQHRVSTSDQGQKYLAAACYYSSSLLLHEK